MFTRSMIFRLALVLAAAGATLSQAAPGDMNCDGKVDGVDVGPFVLALTNPTDYNATYPNCALTYADLDCYEGVDTGDIGGFVICLLAGNCLPCPPPGMVVILADTFNMGDNVNDGVTAELPVHNVYVSQYYMDRYEVTNYQYADALNWAMNQGSLITVTSGVVYKYNSGTSYPYCDTTTSFPTGSQITWNGSTFNVTAGKENHPMILVSWYGSAAYSNWRSAMQGFTPSYDTSTWVCNFAASGYRLPTEAEWEKAARGGAAGHRFPWSETDTIQHTRANYQSLHNVGYDTSPTSGFHPTFNTGVYPYTSPVGYFAPNGYGLYDMTGNVVEWCNDWFWGNYYSSSPGTDPPGPLSGTSRVLRGGGWSSLADWSRCAHRVGYVPFDKRLFLGFRLVLD
ncbi:MAG: SUMF1/EgtB/PvdO family nonheme iron enzyme [Planctomycetota bacterium]